MEYQGQFGVVDIIVLVGVFAISVFNGIFFWYRARGKTTTKLYYYGGKQVSPITLGVSLAVTMNSAISQISYPVEVYKCGIVHLWPLLTFVLAGIITIVYFIDIYHQLQLKSTFEFLELRFNSTARRCCAALITFAQLLYMSVTIFLPALAISSVSPLSIEWSIVITTVTATFYTSLGGLKAIVWSDFIQAFFMILGTASVFIYSVASFGFAEIAEALIRGRRNELLSQDIDASSDCSPISLVFGMFFSTMFPISTSPVFVQRYLATKTPSDAKRALVIFVILAIVLNLIAIGNGIVMYAYFEGCDPYLDGKVFLRDQTLPYMASQIFSGIPGLIGLFVAGIYCGTLSMVSSGINSFSEVVLQDFILVRWPSMSERVKIIVSRLIGLLFGIILMILAFAVPLLGSNVFNITLSFGAAISGPIMGMFWLGMFVPWANSLGATVGSVVSFLGVLWISLGSHFYGTNQSYSSVLPLSTDMCPTNHTSTTNFTSTTISFITSQNVSDHNLDSQLSFVQTLYNLSVYWNSLIGFLACMIIGIVVSLISGPNNPATVNPKYFVPVFSSTFLPLSVRKFFRFGVPEYERKDNQVYIMGNINST